MKTIHSGQAVEETSSDGSTPKNMKRQEMKKLHKAGRRSSWIPMVMASGITMQSPMNCSTLPGTSGSRKAFMLFPRRRMDRFGDLLWDIRVLSSAWILDPTRLKRPSLSITNYHWINRVNQWKDSRLAVWMLTGTALHWWHLPADTSPASTEESARGRLTDQMLPANIVPKAGRSMPSPCPSFRV